MMKQQRLGRFSYVFLTGFLFILSSLFFYKDGSASSSEAIHYPHLYDDAVLLSTEEHDDLEEMLAEYSYETNLKMVVLTHNNPAADDADLYIENFVDLMGYNDSIVLLIDMHNRDVCIHGYGIAETYLHSKRIDVIIEEISGYLTDGNYFTAFELFAQRATAYMNDDTELNYDHDYSYDADGRYVGNDQGERAKELFTNIWFQLILSLIVGGTAVGIMAYRSGGTMSTGSNTYIDQSNSGLIGRRDHYIRTRVTRVRKPSTNNTSGRGGFNSGGLRGGVSGGGRSHSSGRGKF